MIRSIINVAAEEETIRRYSEYIVNERCTIREAAKKFSISKSSVHYGINNRLKYIDGDLYKEAREVLEDNKRQMHLRGGIARNKKYQESKKALK